MHRIVNQSMTQQEMMRRFQVKAIFRKRTKITPIAFLAFLY